MRALRFLSVLVAALAIVPALTAPAQAAPPDHTTMQIQGMGATAVYPTPSGNGAWYVNFGVGSYTLNGERTPEQPAVSAGIFDSSCSADGLSCTGYGVDAITPVPAGAFTIEPDLSAAVLPPTEVTGHGWASSWWFDPVLGEWQSETAAVQHEHLDLLDDERLTPQWAAGPASADCVTRVDGQDRQRHGGGPRPPLA